jgi:hypothetical protein
VIHRYKDGGFTFIFFGSHLVENFVYERTGLKVSELTNSVFRETLFNLL